MCDCQNVHKRCVLPGSQTRKNKTPMLIYIGGKTFYTKKEQIGFLP